MHLARAPNRLVSSVYVEAAPKEGFETNTKLLARRAGKTIITDGPGDLADAMVATKLGLPQEFEFNGRAVAVLLREFCAHHGNREGFDIEGIEILEIDGKPVTVAQALTRGSLNGVAVKGEPFKGNFFDRQVGEGRRGSIVWSTEEPRSEIWGSEAVP